MTNGLISSCCKDCTDHSLNDTGYDDLYSQYKADLEKAKAAKADFLEDYYSRILNEKRIRGIYSSKKR